MDPNKNGLKCWSMESFESINPKMEWISTVVRKDTNEKRVGSKSLLKEFRIRRERLLDDSRQEPIYLKTVAPFVTGLGRNHPVENGFAWHHTLGVPYLPGSSVKGVVRSWASSWLSQPKEDIKRIFGPRDNPKDHSVGSVIFLDALPIKPVQLKVDIITPHYGPYYQVEKAKTPPADWHSPVPVPFLVVDTDQGFIFGLMPRKQKDKVDCQNANKWLIEALKELGAGAKTAVGYGRFEEFVPR